MKSLRDAVFLTALLAITIPSTVGAASYRFSWAGADGYRLEGALAIPDALAEEDFVDERAVECFRIEGYRHDTPVGSWRLGHLTDQTRWSLNFEPAELQFRTGGHSSGAFGQEWNMHGSGTGCGSGGFGFNAGGAAQDVCINDKFIVSSRIPAATPLSGIRDDDIRFWGADCTGAPLS